MPTYCYKHPETDEIIDEVFMISEVQESITLDDGTVCERCIAAEIAGQGGTQAATWPLKSQAMAVHPSQSKEYSEFAEKHGVPTEFDERGRPEFRTKQHRKRYCELVGATDFDGGYGDPSSERKE